MSFPPEQQSRTLTDPAPASAPPSELIGRIHRTCRGRRGASSCAVPAEWPVAKFVDPYLDAALLHAFGEHALAEQYAATGDATAARHGLWRQIEQDVAT